MTEPVLFPASHAASAAFSRAVVGPGAAGDVVAASPQPRLPPAHRLVRALDAALRHILEIREFTARPDCLLRISLGRADADVRLGDGAAISRGDPVVDLHLWNEQLPSGDASTLACSNALRRRMVSSLGELARYLDAEPSMAGVMAVRGRIACLAESQVEVLRHLAAAIGFEMIRLGDSGGLARRLHDFLENFLIWALAWTFNPRALRGKGLRQPRCELWISRDALVARHARHPGAAHRGGTEGSTGALTRRQGR
ncbi:MAG TPA: hypothetical protein VGR91_04105 [Stellaceae bacterium]|nr:hypothetical protein [Stellaceae bacterium]